MHCKRVLPQGVVSCIFLSPEAQIHKKNPAVMPPSS
jgi:hypothetical protein